MERKTKLFRLYLLSLVNKYQLTSLLQGGLMSKKNFFLLIMGFLTTGNTLNGCGTDSSGTCTDVACFDALAVKILMSESYSPGKYTAEILFSDDESITAEYEITMIEDSDSDGFNMDSFHVLAIQNDSYGISWWMNDGKMDTIEIQYWGRMVDGDFVYDYEFTDEITINIYKDDILIYSGLIAPIFNYYWCNQEAGKCDHRQNKDADFEVDISI
jgi:hypothetical protein